MKKIFAILLLATVTAFVSCENENNSDEKQWFKQPVVTVAGTSVDVKCLTTFGPGVLAATQSGFVYMPVSGGSGAGVTVSNPDIDGNNLSCRLSGLTPKTYYIVYAFVTMGSERLQSQPTLFETGEDGDDPNPDPDPDPDVVEPTFGTPASSDVTKSSASVSCSFAYTGTETITKVSFVCVFPDNSEQAVAVENTDAGEKTAQFSGLAASTTYNFLLRVEIGGKSYASTRASFKTLSGGVTPPPGPTKYAGWPELPVEVSNSDYHYAYHICPDFKVDGHLARNFTVCFSAENHCPIWVAAPRHACYEVKNADRTDAYGKDPAILSSIQYSSKSTGGGCNKGHMLGSAERLVTRETNKQVFYYTNIAPQLSGSFNTGGGAWNNLEGFVDAQVCADTTYIVVGTYFKPFTDSYGQSCSPTTISFGGRKDVTRPSMFYYLILRTKSGSTRKAIADCAPNELKCAAFVLRHNMEKGHKPQAKDMMKVADLEQMTGFTFFANVPNAPKDTFNPSDWGL